MEVFLHNSVGRATLEYEEYDITGSLKNGENTIRIILGNGWYNCCSWGQIRADKPKLMCELELIFEDGDATTIIADESWLMALSPLIENDIQFGERYDARLEPGDNTDWYSAEKADENFQKKFVPSKTLKILRLRPQNNITGGHCGETTRYCTLHFALCTRKKPLLITALSIRAFFFYG